MRVRAFLKYGRQAASSRQRLLQYLPYLSANGVEVEVLPLLGDDHLRSIAAGGGGVSPSMLAPYLRRFRQLVRGGDHDLVWVHYELFPFLPGMFERLAGFSGRPIVCDYDDATFHTYDRHRSGAVRQMLGNKLEPLLSRATACICGNDYLKAYAEQFCPNSVTIPTVVDTDTYVPRKCRGNGPPVVGWIGSPSTWQNVEPLLPTLLPRLRRLGVVFRVIGAGPKAEGIEGIDAVSWSENTEIASVQGLDIGIMPLLDEPFQRGKCGYKLIQYMACGIPVVAAPVGVNSQIVDNGVNGFLASSEAQWLEALDRLIADKELRVAMGAKGRERAVQEYSLAAQQPNLLRVLCQAAAEARPRGRSDTQRRVRDPLA